MCLPNGCVSFVVDVCNCNSDFSTYHGNTDNLLQVSPLRLKQFNLAKKDWVHIVSI